MGPFSGLSAPALQKILATWSQILGALSVQGPSVVRDLCHGGKMCGCDSPDWYEPHKDCVFVGLVAWSF